MVHIAEKCLGGHDQENVTAQCFSFAAEGQFKEELDLAQHTLNFGDKIWPDTDRDMCDAEDQEILKQNYEIVELVDQGG